MTFYRATSTPTEAPRAPLKLVPPEGGDALLKSTPDVHHTSRFAPWAEVRSAWLAAIEAEQHVDVETAHYRTPTTKQQAFALSPVNGSFGRRGEGGLALTPRAWVQLVNLLNDTEDAPRSPAQAYGWLSPALRSMVFAELVARSNRKEGKGHELLLRSFQFEGRTTLRAVLSARHSGEHFDDVALAALLNDNTLPDSIAWVRRGVDYTHGSVVLGGADVEGARATLTFSNSETGAASLSFVGAAYITALNATIRSSVTVATTKTSTRRNHTIPRVGKSHSQRADIASERIQKDIDTATEAAVDMVQAWGRALKTFAPGAAELPQGASREVAASVVLDLIEETTGFTGDDRVKLNAVLLSGALDSLPTLSAAHIAGAFAVLASQQTSFSEAHRLQDLAAQWVLEGFNQ